MPMLTPSVGMWWVGLDVCGYCNVKHHLWRDASKTGLACMNCWESRRPHRATSTGSKKKVVKNGPTKL